MTLRLSVRTDKRVGFIGQTVSGATYVMRWLPDRAEALGRLILVDPRAQAPQICDPRMIAL